MKKTIFSVIALFTISCSADKKSANLVLDSLQCLMCSVNVEESLLSLRGVKNIKVDLAITSDVTELLQSVIKLLSLIHISEPTRLRRM